MIHLDNNRIAEYGFQAKAGAKRDGKKAEAEVDRSEQRKISSDGYYYVMVVEHRGNTRGGDWYTDVLCVATDATLYPGDLGRPAPAAAMARPPTSSSRRRVSDDPGRMTHEPT